MEGHLRSSASNIEIALSWSGVRALVIGDALLDTYVDGIALRLGDERPIPVIQALSERHAAGGAANTAAVLRALGAEVTLIGLVGSDSVGMLLRQALRTMSIDDGWLVEDRLVSTLRKRRIRANDQYIVRVDEGDTRSASESAHQQMFARIEEAFPRSDLIVVSDYLYGAVSNDVIHKLSALRAERPCVLAVDSKDVLRFASSKATVVTPNRHEAEIALDPDVAHGRAPSNRWLDVEQMVARLLGKIDADQIVITLASDGAVLGDRTGTLAKISAPNVPGADAIGAGDTFVAAMALALSVGADAVQAAGIGVGAASIAVAKDGTGVPDFDELLRRLAGRQRGAFPSTPALGMILETERAGGRTVVFTCGVFDLLHTGHLHLLHQAKLLGDILVVGVNSDDSVRRLKGDSRPIVNQHERASILASISAVDHVIVFEEDSPEHLIRALRPDIHVKGADYDAESLPEAAAVREVGGQMVFIPRLDGRSTSDIVARILSRTTSPSGP